MTTPAILRKAAMRVRQGWCQDKLSAGGRVCALAAILDAAGKNRDIRGRGTRAELAMEALLNGAVGAWNDDIAESAEEVAMTMELCALLTEEGNDAVQG